MKRFFSSVSAFLAALLAIGLAASCPAPKASVTPPEARFAYVASGSDLIQALEIASDGSLSPIADVPCTSPFALALNPVLNRLYVAELFNDIWQFTVGETGALEPMDPASVYTGGAHSKIVMHPSGSFAFMADIGSGLDSILLRLTLDPVSGAITDVDEVSVAAGGSGTVSSLAIDPSGSFLYASIYEHILQFSINPATGALTALSPGSIEEADSNIYSLVVHPDGGYLYGHGYDETSIRRYRIGSDGTLSAMASADAAAICEELVIDHAGGHLYGLDSYNNELVLFNIGADGALERVVSIPTDASSTGFLHSMKIDPSGDYAYVTINGTLGSLLLQYSISADGRLHPLSTPSVELEPYARDIVLSR